MRGPAERTRLGPWCTNASSNAPPIGDDVPIVTEPAPDEMCDQGSVPQAAAYDVDDGTFRWVSCTDELAWRTVRAVADDAVHIETGNTQELAALDPASGDVLTRRRHHRPRTTPVIRR